MMNLLTDNIPWIDGQILFDGTDILKLGKDFRRVLGYIYPSSRAITNT